MSSTREFSKSTPKSDYESDVEDRQSQTVTQELRQASLCLIQIFLYSLELALRVHRGYSLYQ